MIKTVCYQLTRNIYPNVIPSLKSLLKNGSVDSVVLMIEDDDIGFDLPDKVLTINMSQQKFIRKDSPNYSCKWTYMCLLKTAVPYIFPHHKRILTLDVDTIVHGDLSPLWDIPMDDHYLAGAIEPFWTENGKPYVNAGVIMWNCEKLRKDSKVNAILNALNTVKYELAEQECINSKCAGQIYVFGPEWNAGTWTHIPLDGIKIRHYMAMGQIRFQQIPEVQQYAAMTWDEVVRRG